MDKGKLGRMMRRGKYEVLRAKWTEEEEEERFKLLPDPPLSETPPRPPLMGGGGRLRRFARGLIMMIRTAAASVADFVAGRPDVIPATSSPPTSSPPTSSPPTSSPPTSSPLTSSPPTSAPPTKPILLKMTILMRLSVWLVPAGRTAATVAGTTTHLCLKIKENIKNDPKFV